MNRLGDSRYLDELVTETARLASAVRGSAATDPVPTCPEWTVDDLVAHVAAGFLWASVIVEERKLEPMPNPTVTVPADAGDRSTWLVAGAQRLADAVRATGPSTPVWTWATERTAGFWLRKLTNDTVIHRVDAELAVGRSADVAPDLAADGVTDLLISMTELSAVDSPDPVFAALRGTGETLQFVATDTGTTWLAERTPDGVRWKHGPGPADVSVRGPGRDLLLVLNRRLALPLAGMAVAGSERVFTDWLARSAF
jgi:uncharacterized protein (TIGR03083 family)